MKKVYRIHPAIGVARLGDSPSEYFIGPESPGILPSPTPADDALSATGKYKDSQHRIKRQGARFRVYEYVYTSAGALKDVREVTAADARIRWSVHLANRKAAGPRFGGTGRRNKRLPVADLVIDAKLQKIEGTSQPMKPVRGKFRGIAVPLGDLLTDSAGRLIVLGGFGHSQSVPAGRILMHFANNDGWCDDASDGPVGATVQFVGSSKAIKAEPAWVIVAPPDFAPAIENVITLYDVVYDVAAKLHPAFKIRRNMPVSFTQHVYPLLKRVCMNIWVNYMTGRGHGPQTGAYFLAPEQLALLSDNSKADHSAAPHAHLGMHAHHDDSDVDTSTPAGRRQHTFEHLRNPHGGGGDMPMLNPQRGPGAPALPEFQYEIMSRWAEGDFLADWPGQEPIPQSLDQMAARDQPPALDRSALEACVGAAFFPGIEASDIMLKRSTYDPRRPFRISARLKPGTLTESMAVPWQADFRECSTNWWPAQRPNEVLRDGPNPVHWVPTSWQRETMVQRWSELGFVVKEMSAGQNRFVEEERNV
ncbi:MAG TPA: LodA/GoxA family CTQ-dependent oxidase [Terriglobia bacterium]|nr:LodA/GoxA family CTQ-dependent oxidase [Terriglobia bacterium]